MTFPKSVFIGAQEWKIKVIEPALFMRIAIGFGQDPASVGFCEFSERIILLRKDRPSEMLHTFLHEVRHAYQHESGLSQFFDGQTMEMDAQGFASLVTGMFDVKFKTKKVGSSK